MILHFISRLWFIGVESKNHYMLVGCSTYASTRISVFLNRMDDTIRNLEKS